MKTGRKRHKTILKHQWKEHRRLKKATEKKEENVTWIPFPVYSTKRATLNVTRPRRHWRIQIVMNFTWIECRGRILKDLSRDSQQFSDLCYSSQRSGLFRAWHFVLSDPGDRCAVILPRSHHGLSPLQLEPCSLRDFSSMATTLDLATLETEVSVWLQKRWVRLSALDTGIFFSRRHSILCRLQFWQRVVIRMYTR